MTVAFNKEKVDKLVLKPTEKEISYGEKLLAMHKKDPEKATDLIVKNLSTSHYQKFRRFLEHSAEFTDKEYWYGLRTAYDTSDNMYSLRHEVKAAFSSKRLHREYLMNTSERKKFKTLPEEFQIYRAMSLREYLSGDFGVSWTESKKVARFFAEKYGRNIDTAEEKKMIHGIIVNKKDIIACFDERAEEEIIYVQKENSFKVKRQKIQSTPGLQLTVMKNA